MFKATTPLRPSSRVKPVFFFLVIFCDKPNKDIYKNFSPCVCIRNNFNYPSSLFKYIVTYIYIHLQKRCFSVSTPEDKLRLSKNIKRKMLGTFLKCFWKFWCFFPLFVYYINKSEYRKLFFKM